MCTKLMLQSFTLPDHNSDSNSAEQHQLFNHPPPHLQAPSTHSQPQITPDKSDPDLGNPATPFKLPLKCCTLTVATQSH